MGRLNYAAFRSNRVRVTDCVRGGQQEICLSLVFQTHMQRALVVAKIQLPGEGCRSAVRRHLIVFQLLRRGDESGITKLVPLQDAEHLFGFVHQPFHGLMNGADRIT